MVKEHGQGLNAVCRFKLIRNYTVSLNFFIWINKDIMHVDSAYLSNSNPSKNN